MDATVRSLPSLTAPAALQTSSVCQPSLPCFVPPKHTSLVWKTVPKHPAEPNSTSLPVPPPTASGCGGEQAATSPHYNTSLKIIKETCK